MTTTSAIPTQRDPELLGQKVVVIGGSAGIGLETARRARAEGSEVVLTGRNPDRLEQASRELDAHAWAAFDVNDHDALRRFFNGQSEPINHVMVTAGAPHYGRMLEMSSDEARQALSEHMLLAIE